MKKYEYDIEKTMELILDEDKNMQSKLFAIDNEGYSKIYSKSNEDLITLFQNFSVKDKKVLTVLSSSDQYFMSYYMGAKSVDTFDLNCLTEYYYYLRKWLIEYKQEFYPNFGRLKKDNSWIEELLMLVEAKSERELAAYNYWQLYIKRTTKIDNNSIFIDDLGKYDLVINDFNRIKELVNEKRFSFIKEDISGNISKDKKYNVIILSNILEYSTFDMERLMRIRDNLFSILEDNGQIIASHLMNFDTALSELEIFSRKFDFYDFPRNFKDSLNKVTGGYCYTKK